MKRPFGVIIVGILLLIEGLFLVALGLAVIFLQAIPSARVRRQLFAFDFTRLTVADWLSAVLLAALGIFIVLSGVGVLRLRVWAWLVAMALQGWTLAIFLISYFTHGQSSYLSVILSVVIVFYLNSRTVRRTFDLIGRHTSTGAAKPPTITHAGVTTGAEVTSRSDGAS